ncbi:glycoside hydrolase family 28 protein [Pedobacter heparinus]|uniref:glycoside hydrolase family 28 protein n=1 Tax=Pedobacter heparinus TaxID=984 RepID=UPI002931ED01|nr:glycosyl hydrolase family 28 protein [Pedobacter heparinus]
MRRFLFLLLTSFTIHALAADVTISTYGAKGDGNTVNTLAIQKSIDACAASGGGKVIFPAGNFISATLVLKSNVTLYLSEGCTLTGIKGASNYPYQQAGIPFYGENWAKQALIYANKAENIGIEGAGTIDGQGGSFEVNTIKKPDRYKDRPYLIWFIACKKISVKQVHLRNSAFWMQHYLGCEDLVIDGISIWNHSNKNNDMIDIDGCKNVRITNVTGDSDDDGLTLKSTSKLISENIVINNCVFSSHCNGLKFGTESTGGFRNVTISNIVIKPSAQLNTIYGKPAGNSGISLEMVDGGIMENISISNVVIDGPQVPLFIRLGNRARKHTDDAAAPGTGIARNIHISNVTATGADITGSSVIGLDNAIIENVSLNNISISTSGGATADAMFRKLESLDDHYPEATMFGPLPAYGLFVKNVKGIQLNDIRFTFTGKDERPAVALENTSDFVLKGLTMASTANANAAIYLKNVANGLITANSLYTYAKHFIWKEGSVTAVSVSNNQHPKIKSSSNQSQKK